MLPRRAARVDTDELAAWLVEIVAAGTQRREGEGASELADWLMAAVPRGQRAAVGHLWCWMNGLVATRSAVVPPAGPLTLEQARHVVAAVRRRALGVVQDELAAQAARRRREVPAGDLFDGAVA